MTVANYNVNQIWLQLVKNQHKVNFVVVVLLSVILLAYAAELTWRLIPAPQVNQSVSATSKKQVKSSPEQANLNLSGVKKLNLFGDLTAKPVVKQVVTEAPVTRLNLTLTGVVASTAEDSGAAIIENRGQQQTYGIGEKIEGTNAVLSEVHVDRVIIKNGAQHETLMLDGIDYTRSPAQPVQSPANSPSENRGSDDNRRILSDEALEATRELQAQPSSFTDYISISPHRPNGDLQGYRVRPGQNPSLFNAAGLVAGDVVTEINGLDLTDMQQSMEAMNMLKELQSLQMTVLRDEELLTIYLDLPQGEEEF